VSMGKRETAHRECKRALDARAEAQKLFGKASAQYVFANTHLTDAISRLPKPQIGLELYEGAKLSTVSRRNGCIAT